METLSIHQPSRKTIWTGRAISILCTAFLLFDAIMKIILEHHSIEGSVQLGWPRQGIQGIGITLLISTVLYIIPRTAVLGAVLVTAYLGGAVAVMARLGVPFYFPIAFGVLLWVGLFLREPRLRLLFPIKS